MKAVESEGTSVEEALNRALLLLGLDSEQVDVSVLRDPGTNGGSETAIVRVQPKGLQDAPSSEPPSPPREKAAEEVESKPAVEPANAKPSKERPPREARWAGKAPQSVSGETPVQEFDDASGDEVPLTDEEGDRADRAGDFLEDLFELLNLDCYVEVAADKVEGRVLIDIAGPDTGVIIGRKGGMLDAVELVLNRAMDNVDGGGIRIALDAEGYRERRTEKLKALAGEQARKVAQTKRPVALEPMNARERRIVHMALEGNRSVRTRSENEGPDRHVIIEPIRARSDS